MLTDGSLNVAGMGEAAARKVLQCFTLEQMVAANERILLTVHDAMGDTVSARA
jgi:hypothetical protein